MNKSFLCNLISSQFYEGKLDTENETVKRKVPEDTGAVKRKVPEDTGFYQLKKKPNLGEIKSLNFSGKY